MKKKFYRFLSLFLAVILAIGIVQLPHTASAAVASGISAEMADNVFLDALAYTGYDVQGQIDDGTLFVEYAWKLGQGHPVFSNITYDYSCLLGGDETVADSTTKTGLAPNIARFESQGLCCASYVGYVYYNYLPNIAGYNMSAYTKPTYLNTPSSWVTAAESWVANGAARKISFTHSSDGNTFTPSEEIPIGSLIVFRQGDEYTHVALYAGYYNGTYFTTHVGNSRGPEINVIEGFQKDGSPQLVAHVYVPKVTENFGEIHIYKKDQSGNSLSGAYFLAKGSSTGVEHIIGPTDSNGYAYIKDIELDSYTVTETVYPTNYKAPSADVLAASGGALDAYGRPYWTVNLATATEGRVTINAVNEIIPGAIQIVKTSEDGSVDGITFTVSGNGVTRTAVTANGGKVSVGDLKPGTYTVTESVPDKYTPQSAQTVTVTSGQTTTATFSNILKRGTVTVTKTSEDGIVAGMRFRLTGTSLSGTAVDLYATTDASGVATFNGVLIGTDYTLQEVDTPVRYIVPAAQKVNVTYGGNTQATFYNELKCGTISIEKTSEDHLVDGITFTVSGNGVTRTVTTANGGKVLVEDLKPGTYTVTESVPDKYKPQSVQTVTVVGEQTSTVTFSNTLKRGSVTVTKTSEDGIVENMKFHLSGTSLSGQEVDMYATTDGSGVATFENVLIGTGYILEEVETAARYIVPDAQSVNVEWDKDTKAAFYNELKRGTVTVKKTTEDGVISGMKFRLTGTSLSGAAIDLYATTNASGIATFEDVLIGTGYTLEEVETKEWYITPAAQTVDVEWNQTTETDFYNELKRGTVTVTKTSEDNIVAGLKFHLTGTSQSGAKVDLYATTDASGVAIFENVLIGTGYILEEAETPSRYVIPADQNVNVAWNETSETAFHNTLKKFRVTVSKIDAETTAPQGDAILQGAVYGIYKGNALIDTYVTDVNGKFTTSYYVCGDDWSIQEITPSEGYLLNPDAVHIDGESTLYTVELNDTANTVTEQVKKGRIAITKHTDDGSTQIETPEVGAEFEVFLKASGSYASAKDSERHLMVCDEYGYAETKDLPFGVYTVKQTKSQEGKELLPAYDVVISENGKVYRYLINNATHQADIEIQKQDAETGKIIPAAGIGFKVRNVATGEFITQHINYPTPVDIDVFYTDTTGKLMLPEALLYGNYEVIEVQTADGYVLDSTPIPFTVDGTTDVVTVIARNIPQKGTITLTKTGEVFSSVSENNGVYQPVYEVKGLAGAVFTITAAEDIITGDGTVRYRKGDVVDTVTTGTDGAVTTRALYLGKYEIREITAPYGTVLNTEVKTVQLTYAGPTVTITTAAESYVNDRQKATVDLVKVLEQSDVFGIGMNDEILSVQFALYAAEDLTAYDGKVIPKDGLIETATCGKDGKIVFATDLPMDATVYVKEVATDSHYILSDATYPITFSYAGQDVASVIISVNNGVSIKNELIRGDIVGKKIDEDGFSVAGATFGLFRKDETVFTVNTALMISVSNEIGIFGFESVPYGSWIVREIVPSAAFVLNETKFPVTISRDGQTVELTVENKFITGTVQVEKVDSEFTDWKLSGAVFEVYVDVDGDRAFHSGVDLLVGELSETETGIYTLSGLRYNGYFLHEKTAPEGWLCDGNYYYFEIRTDGQIATVENKPGVGFVNDPILGSVQTVKVDLEKPDVRLSGAVFEIYFDVNGNKIFNPDVDTLIGQLTETELGLYRLENLRYGGYFLYEKTPPEGYLSDGNYHYFEIRIHGKGITVENAYNVGFTNELIRGDIVGKKIDEDGFAIAGATFGLFYGNETEFTAENAVMISVSNEIGVFGFEEVAFGSWIVRELTPSFSFVLNETQFPVTISKDGEIIELTVENRFITGTVRVEKVDAEFPEHKLSGAVFEVYVDVDGDKVFDPERDLLVKELSETETGIYTLSGLRYNGYFLHEKTAPEGFLADDNYYYFEIRTDGETVPVENKSGVGFVNVPMKGSLEILKKDADDGTPLAGVGFQVKDSAGKVVAEGLTDTSGTFRADGLRTGKYTYEESVPLEGYIPNETVSSFEITEDGQVVRMEVVNKKKPIPENPDTEDIPRNTWFGLAGLGLSGLWAALAITQKQRRKEEN